MIHAVRIAYLATCPFVVIAGLWVGAIVHENWPFPPDSAYSFAMFGTTMVLILSKAAMIGAVFYWSTEAHDLDAIQGWWQMTWKRLERRSKSVSKKE